MRLGKKGQGMIFWILFLIANGILFYFLFFSSDSPIPTLFNVEDTENTSTEIEEKEEINITVEPEPVDINYEVDTDYDLSDKDLLNI